ncbi:MAG: phosphoribosyltransferase [Cyanobacteria bacterium RYN_339]|nr:phosphoribosyltransferase [Cyanobacteria bacterium RYN_339]
MGLVARALAAVWRLRCAGCGNVGTAQLCAACQAAWPPAIPLAGVTAAGALAGPARRAIHQLKYRNRRRVAPALTARLAPLLPPGPWLVVPVPLHRVRLRQRGYNQAALLARALARQAGWPYLDALVRARATAPSPGLGRADRAANVAGVFEARRALFGRRVLLVDDVLTTGATTDAAREALLAAGAAEVHVAVVARML